MAANYRPLSVHHSTANPAECFLPLSIAPMFYTVETNPTFNSAVKLGAKSKFNTDRELGAISKYFPERELSQTRRASVYRRSCRKFRTATERPQALRRLNKIEHSTRTGNYAMRDNQVLLKRFYAIKTKPDTQNCPSIDVLRP